MDGLYEWVRNITYFLIFMTVITNLLPNKKYEKYIKLFSGMVLVLLVIKPLTGGLKLDQKIAYYFESFSFQKEVDELGTQLLGMEGKRIDNMISQYQKQVGEDMASMAEHAGFTVLNVDVKIDREENSVDFGHIIAVSMAVDSAVKPQEGKDGIDPIEAVEAVKPIKIERIDQGEEKESDLADREQRKKETAETIILKRKLAEYYDMEENDIEIQLEVGER